MAIENWQHRPTRSGTTHTHTRHTRQHVTHSHSVAFDNNNKNTRLWVIPLYSGKFSIFNCTNQLKLKRHAHTPCRAHTHTLSHTSHYIHSLLPWLDSRTNVPPPSRTAGQRSVSSRIPPHRVRDAVRRSPSVESGIIRKLPHQFSPSRQGPALTDTAL